MDRRHSGWRRLVLPTLLFGAALGAALWSWRVAPPLTSAEGRVLNGRNGPGDLTVVGWLLGVEYAITVLALQPWARRPRRRWLGLAGVAFGVWGALRLLVGLHSPPVLLPHDLLMFVVALVLCALTLVFPAPSGTSGGAFERHLTNR